MGRVHPRVGDVLAAAPRELPGDPRGHRTAPALGSQASRAAGSKLSETGFIPGERIPPALSVSLARSAKIGQDRTLLGVAVFIASESVFFLAIVLAYLAYRDAGLATAKASLDIGRTMVFSVALFASSATMALATGMRSGRWLAATIALGAIFLV